ncbi:virulence-associated V antigen [Aeromonas veronii]|uniref:virulence-associated V antigen n=1 Tax=Aeromonas veronii TaxID=654 RepID=UPI003D1A14B9
MNIYSKQFDFSGLRGDINQTTQEFFLAQQNALLSELKGADSSYLTEVVDWIKHSGLSVTHQPLDSNGQPEGATISVLADEALLTKIIAYFLPLDPNGNKGFYHDQVKSGIANLKGLVTKIATNSATRNLTLTEFLMTFNAALDVGRIDDDIIQAMRGTMRNHSERREKIRDDVTLLTAELKIYAVIQSEVNNKLSTSGHLRIDETGLNLLNYRLYGYESLDSFMKGGEWKVLQKLGVKPFTDNNVTAVEEKIKKAQDIQSRLAGGVDAYIFNNSGRLISLEALREEFHALERERDLNLKEAKEIGLTIKEFLESSNKETGPISGLSNEYAYDKENNRLGNFSTTLSDRSRPLNDKVSQKTTELNDISSRYNSAIEALNRFIQKYESMMQQILQAI